MVTVVVVVTAVSGASVAMIEVAGRAVDGVTARALADAAVDAADDSVGDG